MSELSEHVSSLELSRKMQEIPALQEASKDSALMWDWDCHIYQNGKPHYEVFPRSICTAAAVPAWLCDEMLVLLKNVRAPSNHLQCLADSDNDWRVTIGFGQRAFDITDPDDLACACIVCAGEM